MHANITQKELRRKLYENIFSTKLWLPFYSNFEFCVVVVDALISGGISYNKPSDQPVSMNPSTVILCDKLNEQTQQPATVRGSKLPWCGRWELMMTTFNDSPTDDGLLQKQVMLKRLLKDFSASGCASKKTLKDIKWVIVWTFQYDFWIDIISCYFLDFPW